MFAVDVLACSACDGRLELIAFISDQRIARKILEHLELDATGPPVAAARRPQDSIDTAPDYDAFAAIDRALRAVKASSDHFRVVHFTAQTNHLHLLAEADDARALSRGMQALEIRVARGVNRAFGRTGRLWADRFQARALRSPREVRAAVCYVVQNTRRHATTDDERVDPSWIDPRSSGPWFDGWRDAPRGAAPASDPPTSPARSWLLATGWRRAGLIRVDEVPPAAFR